MTKKHVDRAVLFGLIVMAVLLYLSTAEYRGIAQKTSAKYVQFLAVSIGVLSTVQLIYSLLQDKTKDRFEMTERPMRFGALLVGLVIFAAVFETLGFFIPAAVFIPVMAVILGYTRPIPIALTTIAILAFVYLVFIQLLAVHLPGLNF